MPLINPPPYTPRNGISPPRNNGSSSRTGRSLSLRAGSGKRSFFSSLRGPSREPQLSKRLFKLIKTENNVIDAYETAGKERQDVAKQLSEWGENSGDDCVSDISDKLGCLLVEIGNQETLHAQALEDARAILKAVRNMEASVQPSRDHKARIQEEIAKLKYKDPQSTRITQLEQELVRAEAENLVAEAQLSNVTRSKLKEAYVVQLAAVIERCEKQVIIAKHGMKLLNYLNDTPILPGESAPAYECEREAADVLREAEDALREWTDESSLEEAPSTHPALVNKTGLPHVPIPASLQPPQRSHSELGTHPAFRKGKARDANPGKRSASHGHTVASSSAAAKFRGVAPYPVSEAGDQDGEVVPMV